MKKELDVYCCHRMKTEYGENKIEVKCQLCGMQLSEFLNNPNVKKKIGYVILETETDKK